MPLSPLSLLFLPVLHRGFSCVHSQGSAGDPSDYQFILRLRQFFGRSVINTLGGIRLLMLAS